jgi:hypothetical protein
MAIIVTAFDLHLLVQVAANRQQRAVELQQGHCCGGVVQHPLWEVLVLISAVRGTGHPVHLPEDAHLCLQQARAMPTLCLDMV